MKSKFFVLLLLYSAMAMAQSKLSIEAKYPVPVGNNFIGENYKGIAGLGIKYSIKNLPLVDLGISVDASLLNLKKEGAYFPEFDEYLSFKTRLFIIQPRIFAAFKLKNITRLHPEAALGYSFFMANATFDSASGIPDQSSSQSGVNLNIGLAFDVTNRFYLRAGYDFVKITQLDNDAPDTSYNTNIGTVEFGLGIRL
ncbi:outer membrane beta-barrel protein [Flavobacterium pallidum]|uniref:Outer membrane protein beta-barrel domain-containing protein n=1 Tax=Flavobacterium pallidum TaxID=2172098 RepID=A0A2S1SHL3_9FLAO|nr:outer membrane beta-barrel protein [Flavobacterium pallidum]AWI25904.1 hypothetical protein HYN49_08320 [Flavobacterium pallidum]